MGSEFGFNSPNPSCKEQNIGWAHDSHWKGEDTRVLLCTTHTGLGDGQFRQDPKMDKADNVSASVGFTV